MIGDVSLLDPDRAQERVAELFPIQPLLHRRDGEVAGAPVGDGMIGRLEIAGHAQQLAPAPQLLVAVGLALLRALLQRQPARDRPDLQQVHRLVTDGEAEATRQCQEPLVTEIGPRRRHRIVVVDRSFGHGTLPAASGRNAQIGFPDEWVVGEDSRRSVEHDPSGIHHEGMLRQFQRRDHVLLDQQDGQPGCVDLGQRRASSSTMRGAKPSESSSIISRRGAAISPRAIAHICCSPPDKRRCILIAPLVKPRRTSRTRNPDRGGRPRCRRAADRRPSADCRGRSSRRTAGALPARG